MKKIFFIAAMFSVFNAVAQIDSKIVLNKGQKVIVVSLIDADTDMGMGMQIKNTYTTTSELNVISEDKNNYSISSKTTRIIIAMNMMGQETKYDSDKPEDQKSELGKELSVKSNVGDTLLVNKTSGVITGNKKDSPERPEKPGDDNPMMSMMGGGLNVNSSEVILNGAFLVIPKDKKVGDSWSDSTSEKTISTKRTYTIKSIDNDIATVIIKGTMAGNGEAEMQGTSVPFTIDTKITGETTVNIKTGLVSKTVNSTDANITVDMMGQSMPMTSKGTTTITYQY